MIGVYVCNIFNNKQISFLSLSIYIVKYTNNKSNNAYDVNNGIVTSNECVHMTKKWR